MQIGKIVGKVSINANNHTRTSHAGNPRKIFVFKCERVEVSLREMVRLRASAVEGFSYILHIFN